MRTLLERLTRVLSARGRAVELRDAPRRVHSGDDLKVTLEVLEGDAGTRLTGVTVRLEEERVDFEHPRWGGFMPWRTAASATISVPARELAPHERLTLSLALPVPEGLEASAPHRRYRLSVEVQPAGRFAVASSLVEVAEGSSAAARARAGARARAEAASV